jgi:ArsR family transcriptional regulator, arsenate/arsenite/antimonite-responsive transcriptional repressor
MEKQDILAALAALAHETRLDVFRRLVRAGRDGVAAGRVGSDLGIPPATLSFHLKELRSARLVTGEREGRVIRYAPDFGVIAEVVGYLGENCCREEGGRGPAVVAEAGGVPIGRSPRNWVRAGSAKKPARSRKGVRR